MLGNFDDSDPELVGFWKMNAGEGDVLYDHSGNQNHGTINEAIWEELILGCVDPAEKL